MLDKDKLWLQFNICTEGLADEDVPKCLQEVAHQLAGDFDDSVKAFFLPTKRKDLPVIQVIHPKFYKNGEETDDITFEDFTDEQNVKFRKVLHNGVFLGEIEILPDEQ